MTVMTAENAGTLADFVDDCEALGIRRRLLLLRLPPNIARPLRPAVRRMLTEQIAPFAAADRARLFRLGDEDLAIAWREGGPGDRAMDAAADQLRILLSGGANARDGSDEEAVVLCRLPADADRARRFLDVAAALQSVPAVWHPAGRPLDLRELAVLEQALAQADVARFVRRHRVWEFTDDAARVRWEHRRLDLADLAASLSPGHDLAADPWLFRRLSRTLDRRMLALLTDAAETRSAPAFMLDLEVGSILDPMFRRFDDALPHGLRGSLALRLSPADLVADPASFCAARDAARARGHSLALAARHPALLASFPLHRTGLDHVELSWRELQGTEPDLFGTPPERVLLTDVPDAAALAHGRLLGIRLFAGAGLDRLS